MLSNFLHFLRLPALSLKACGKNYLPRRLCLSISSLPLMAVTSISYAILPAPINNALIQAGLSPSDISVVIMPLPSSDAMSSADSAVEHMTSDSTSLNDTRVSSHLPPAVLPKSKLDAETYVKQHIATRWQLDILSMLDSVLKHSTPNADFSAFDIRALDNMTLDFVAPEVFGNSQPLTQSVRHNATLPRTPASTMKLIPTFIALDKLGSDFVWQTRVYHTGYISDDVLHGDLIIRGSGDPKLTSNRLALLLSLVQQAGIGHIEGNIILDSSIFQHVGKDPAVFDNDPLRPYNASPDGFLVNFNSMEITTTPQASGLATLHYTPKLADYELPESIYQRSGRCSSIRLSLNPTWAPDALLFGKRLPRSCQRHTFYIAHPNPKVFSEQIVKQQWQTLGNTLTGDVISTENANMTPYASYSPFQNGNIVSASTLLASSRLPIASINSFPLAKQIYDINHYSNNVMTEQVMLSLAAYNNGTEQTGQDEGRQGYRTRSQSAPLMRRPASYADAITEVTQWWQRNLDSPPPHMTNGSGLCRTCTVTADNLAELLQYAYEHPEFNNYINSMGIAGIDGTIATHSRRSPNSAAIGRAWIKTGTLDNVTAMAGYIKGRSGQDYVVVGIINTPHKLNATKARRVLDAMLDWTARH